MCTKYTPSHYSTYLIFIVSYRSCANSNTFSTVCCTSCESFTSKLTKLHVYLIKKLWNFKLQKMVKFYVHISPVFSCWVTNNYLNLIYLCMYTCINTLNSFCCICNFSQYLFDHYHRHTQISFYIIHFVNYVDNFCLLCWYYAQCFCHPIKLKIMLV